MSVQTSWTPVGHPSSGSPAAPRRNTLSWVAVVCLFFCSPAAVVLGVIARRQIARTGERGRGIATTAVVLSALSIVAGVVLAVVVTAGLSTSPATVPAPVAGPPAASPVASPVSSVRGATVASTITTQTHGRAQRVTCPDLPAVVGATTTCTAAVDGAPARIRAKVTSVAGTHVGFGFDQVP